MYIIFIGLVFLFIVHFRSSISSYEEKIFVQGCFVTPLPHNFSFYKLLLTFGNSQLPLGKV